MAKVWRNRPVLYNEVQQFCEVGDDILEKRCREYQVNKDWERVPAAKKSLKRTSATCKTSGTVKRREENMESEVRVKGDWAAKEPLRQSFLFDTGADCNKISTQTKISWEQEKVPLQTSKVRSEISSFMGTNLLYKEVVSLSEGIEFSVVDIPFDGVVGLSFYVFRRTPFSKSFRIRISTTRFAPKSEVLQAVFFILEPRKLFFPIFQTIFKTFLRWHVALLNT